MPTTFESAQLILKLFELRREPLLRQARAWFLTEFNPATFEELMTLAGERNAWFRMVVGYWDMAASLVTFGAIDPAMFRAANSEMVVTFAKVEPFLADFRRGAPEYLTHLEKVVREMPGSTERLALIREQLRAAAAYGREASAGTASS